MKTLLNTLEHKPGIHNTTLAANQYVGKAIADERKANKWIYVIATTVRWCNKEHAVIQLTPHSQQQKLDWLEKAICCGQTRLIFIENLAVTPLQEARLKRLSNYHGVAIINLKVPSNSANVISGPW